MSERRVAVSMIVGDSWRPEEIKNLLDSMEMIPDIKHLYVNYNGQKSRSPSWRRWTTIPITWARNEWKEDFALARNQSLAMVPMDQYDWWMWVDADDKIVTTDGFDRLFDQIESHRYLKGATIRYAYSIEPKTKTVVIDQWRERLFSTNWQWQWKWPIHELVQAPQGTPMLKYVGEPFIEHQRLSGEQRGTRERNRKIIMRAMREQPNEPRHRYYFANEAHGAAMHEKDPVRKVMLAEAAIMAWKQYLAMKAPKSPDQEYRAGYHMGELFHIKGDYAGAIDCYMQTARDRPDWPYCWHGCAKAAMDLQDWERMYTFADIAGKLKRPETTVALESQNYGFMPLFLRGIACEAMGKYQQALEDLIAARKEWDDPNNKLDERIAYLRKRIRKAKTEEPVSKILEKRRGSRADKSIAFFTNPIPETWNQKTLAEGGHGGAETLVLELAPRFAADDWRVSVFGCPGDAEGVGKDGVEYWKSEDWIPNEAHTIFISSRAAGPFTGPINSKATFLWMHDVNVGPGLRYVSGVPNVIVPISQWHKNHLIRLYGIPENRFEVIPNGIDLRLYPETPNEDGHKFIWSSSPDRGLDTVLALWPSIREMLPDATLEVFYGWEFIDKILKQRPDHHAGQLKQRVMTMWNAMEGEKSGLHWFGRQPPATLAKHQIGADIWAYPTMFMETYCLTGIQAQAAGCIPITSSLAALTENIVASDLVAIDGWSKNSDYQGRFLNKLEAVFEDTEPSAALREQMRRKGRAFAETQTIDASYAKWNELIRAVYPGIPS